MVAASRWGGQRDAVAFVTVDEGLRVDFGDAIRLAGARARGCCEAGRCS
jgi:hypothetical protein